MRRSFGVRGALALLVLGAVAVHAAGDYWESRGDGYMRMGHYGKAADAYETALGKRPDDPMLLRKYEQAFLLSYTGELNVQQSEAPARPRFTRPAQVRPKPAPPASEPALESAKGAPETTATTAVAGGRPGVSVRDDGVVEVDFGSLLEAARARGLSGASAVHTPRRGSTEEAPSTEEVAEEVPEEPKGPEVFVASRPVQVNPEQNTGVQGSRGEEVAPEDVVIRSAKYDITGVTVSYDSRGDLHIRGTVTNRSQKIVRNPRVYCRIFDDAGVLRGRTFSYVSPGRNTLALNKPKTFDLHFRGYKEPVESYQFEIIP